MRYRVKLSRALLAVGMGLVITVAGGPTAFGATSPIKTSATVVSPMGQVRASFTLAWNPQKVNHGGAAITAGVLQAKKIPGRVTFTATGASAKTFNVAANQIVRIPNQLLYNPTKPVTAALNVRVCDIQKTLQISCTSTTFKNPYYK
jgi:hypothetical protein